MSQLKFKGPKPTRSHHKDKDRNNTLKHSATAPTLVPDSVLLSLDDPIFQTPNIGIKSRRDRIVDEVFRTEQSYVRSLTVFILHFQNPMTEAAGKFDISAEQLRTLYGNVRDVYALSIKLLEDLNKKISAWTDTQTIGEVFKMLTPFLTLYTTYSLNFEKASAVLTELLDKREGFKEFIDTIQLKPECQGLSFGAYLIMPIQRIPRYRMLLEDLIKNTEDAHPDKKGLNAALGELLVVANKVNQAVIQQENAEKLLKVAKRFQDYKDLDIFKPGRTYITEGEMSKVCRKEAKRRTFFLFSDMFLYAYAHSGGKYKIGKQFAMIHVTVKDIPDAPTRGLQNAFQIKSEIKSFNVLCSSAEDKAKWLKAFNATIDALGQQKGIIQKNADSSKGEAPVWVQDSEVRACKICAIKFTFTNRRHHCRQCGTVVCGQCSGSKKVLAGQGKQRVCDDCYKRSDDVITHNLKKETDGDGFSASSEESLQPIYELEALFDYEPPVVSNAPSKKLAFKQGEKVAIIHLDQSGWWLGELRSGQRGWVPANFLEPPLECA